MSVRAAVARDAGHTSSPVATPASLVWPPLLVALLALAGSVWLSVGMGLKACPLCLYQRTFVMGAVGVLGAGVLAGARHRGVLGLLALPAVVAGFGVAAFHEYLELTGRLECPGGILGLGTAPRQSLAVQAVLLTLGTVAAVRGVTAGEVRWLAVPVAVLLGGLLALGAVLSAPPMPAPPTRAYEAPLEICRPPFGP